ncbi:MAG: hypothetical protein ACOC5L_01420 [Halobacteriota archaeon]
MKRLSLAIITVALLLCGCEEGYSPDQPLIENSSQTATPAPATTQKTTTCSEINDKPTSNPEELDIDEIREHIASGIRNEDVFEPSPPELDSVSLSGDELYVVYTTNRLTEEELFNEIQGVAKLIEEAFIGYENPGRVTIKIIPQKQYNYETSLLWNEFLTLSNGKMPISEWSRNTARSG